MKTIYSFAIAACAATIGVCAAQGQPAIQPGGAEPALPATGKVLLLKNNRILEGDIERDGPRYRIRRRIGESTVDVSQVAAVCETRGQVYQQLRGLANLRDPDERIRLARWCQFHGLLDEGLEEARAALKLVPKSADAQRLVRTFERTLCPPGAQPEEEPQPAATLPDPEPEVVLSVPLNLNCLTQFNNRVQPILMNACTSCHVSGRGGNFQLKHTFGQGGLHGKSTRNNVAMAVNFIDFDNWQRSPLLVKAVGVHGGIERPPLEGKQVAAFQVMEEWVRMVVETSPRPAAPKLDSSPVARTQPGGPEPIFASVAKPVESAPPAQTPPPPVAPAMSPPAATAVPPITMYREPEPTPLPGAPVSPPLANREIHSVAATSGREEPKPNFAAVRESEPAPPAQAAPTTDKDGFHSTFAVAAPAEKQSEPAAPAKLEPLETTPDDPFDPVVFNRQMHGAP